jgi:biotin transporter BioY
MCVIPFLPGDALKIIIAVILGPILKKYLHRAGVLD